VRRWCDDGGASAQDGADAGMMRTKRRRVRGVGIFVRGRVTFYRVEVRRGRVRVPSWPALKPRLGGAGYWSQEGEGVVIAVH
jgi:hypothetical protein